MKNNKTIKVVLIILLINIAATCWLARMVYQVKEVSSADNIKYVMYVGTSDKTEHKQIVSLEEAKKIIKEICTKYVDGYTIQEANGAWANETGHITQENSIVCHFDDADSADIYKIADEIIASLNQNFVLIEKSYAAIEYYSPR